MDEPVRVQRGEPGDELGQRGAEPALVAAPAGSHVVQQRSPLDQLHREPPLTALLDQLAERDEVGMMHILHGTELGLEPEQAIGADALQCLERHPRAALAVERLVDHAHAAATQRAEDLEPAGELSPGDVRRHEVRGAHRFRVAVAHELDHERTALRTGLDVLLGARTGVAAQPTRDQVLDRVLRQAPHHARYTILVSSGLAGVLQESARNPRVRAHEAEYLERRLHQILDACRAAWPALGVPERAFVRHLAEHLPEDGDLDTCLFRMHYPDLYLACGCAVQDPAALRVFDGKILRQTVPVLQRMGLSASQIDEVVQVVRAKLLVAEEPGRAPPIASYAGHGALVGWVRTATRRTALSLRRNKDEQIGSGDDGHGLTRIPIPADVELDYLKHRYQAEFKQAVEDALAGLDAEQLRILRLHYTDGLSIDRIGALLGVHRATAARWIRAASEAVRDETRRLLHARLGLSAAELDSLAGLVQSQLHLSLDRLLRSP
ncbi:MAG TPA: sigma factor-like helix-turn-helix DNA-binding protein [Kofleriaceae bacterium]|jgi:RNA polymerase sigma-70 factor (ECF subfamily)|nr:sigma factor-like helix-turn-helix DNA-binding protein [Kofleriaceae bacterium]